MKKYEAMIVTALCIAIGLILPMLTANIPTLGSMLLPMHLPILLCGLYCGMKYGIIAGVVTPLLRSVMFGMPPLFPVAIAMAFELAMYGAMAGWVYVSIQNKKGSVYPALFVAMLAGRIVWGATMFVLLSIGGGVFTFPMFIAGAFTKAIPGITLQLILIPAIMYALQKSSKKAERLQYE